ncbi:MAG TPA: VanZ family protein [Micropruina sp.]|nr:VanZ family protein [Micropruina sp.]
MLRRTHPLHQERRHMLSQFGPSTWAALLFGGVLAVLAFVPVAAYRYRRAGRLRALDIVVLLIVAVYAVALWSYTLVPVPENDSFRCVGHNLRPFAFVDDVLAGPRSLLANRAFLQAAFNVVLFAPFGFFLRVLRRRGFVVATLAGFGTSLAIELTQLTGVWGIYHCAYRVFDVDDLLLNTTGALLGSLAGLPVRRLLSRRRPLPAVTTVTIGRRLTGMAIDVLVCGLVGFTVTVGWRAIGLYVLGIPFDQLPGWIDQTLLSGVPAVLECYWVLMRGRTIGEDVVQLEPVVRRSSPALARAVKYVTGVGGYLLLNSVLVPWPFAVPLFALVTIGWALRSRQHRGMSHTLAGMELRIEQAADPVGTKGTG